jgi:hypothetical protein
VNIKKIMYAVLHKKKLYKDIIRQTENALPKKLTDFDVHCSTKRCSIYHKKKCQTKIWIQTLWEWLISDT